VWFLLDGDHILINTSAGRVKLRNMEADPRVTLTIVDRENFYRYVQIRGRVSVFHREDGAHDIDRLSLRYRGKPYTYPPTDAPERHVSIYIRPQRFSGLRVCQGKAEPMYLRIDLVSRYSASPSAPNSRPVPLSFTPPKGVSGTETGL